MTKKRIVCWIIVHIIIVTLTTVYLLLITGYTYESGTCWDGYDYENDRPVGGCDLEEKTSYPELRILLPMIAGLSAIFFLLIFVAFEGGS